MPLFEYECRGCGTHFEYLTRDGQSPSCPACKGADLQKQLSVFAAQSSTPAKSFSDRPMQACGSCCDPRGPGSCRMNYPLACVAVSSSGSLPRLPSLLPLPAHLASLLLLSFCCRVLVGFPP